MLQVALPEGDWTTVEVLNKDDERVHAAFESWNNLHKYKIPTRLSEDSQQFQTAQMLRRARYRCKEMMKGTIGYADRGHKAS